MIAEWNMNRDISDFSSKLLDRGARSFSGYAAEKLLRNETGAQIGFGADPRSAWQDLLADRIRDLSTAVAFQSSGVLLRQIHWCKWAFASRGLPVSHLRAALCCLREILVTELPSHANQSALAYLSESIEQYDDIPARCTSPLTTEAEHGRFAAEYLVSIFQGDSDRACRLVLDAAEGGQDVVDIYAHVLAPALWEIGRMWVAGEAGIADEHFALSTTRMLIQQLHQPAARGPGHAKTALAAAVSGNQHDLGLHMAAAVLERQGWRVIQLGANVPVSDLLKAVENHQIDSLFLSAALPVQLIPARDTIDAVRHSGRGEALKIVVGGQAFTGLDGLAEQIGADHYAASVQEIEDLVADW